MENNKPVFYMLVGLPASGKSSESDRLGDVIVRSSDYLRDKLCGDINDMKNNGAVFTILQSLVRADLYHGKDVVYDATNLKASYRVEFLDTLRLLNCKKVCVFVDTKNDRRLQTYTLNYSTGVDEIKDTLDLAIMLGIISQAGAWYKATLKDGKEQKMQGFNGVQEFYYNDLEELEYLRKQVYEAGMV